MKNYKKGFAPVILLIIVVVLGLGGGAYWYLNNSEKGSETTDTQNVLSESTSADTMSYEFKPEPIEDTKTLIVTNIKQLTSTTTGDNGVRSG